ncbi:MAG: c-type cytochrome, partial [Anaerolineae bacterium]|nr:c-type cytochrome [Anaerolineae bacterium]
MTQRDLLTRLLVLFVAAGMPLAYAVYQYRLRDAAVESGERTIHVKAAVPEAGGFQPASFQVAKGETVTLRFTAVDVTHGVAIGPGLGIDIGDIPAGETREVSMTFDEAGTYTFYCNNYCSPEHWRMRGILDIYDPQDADFIPTPWHDPVIAALIEEGVNIDDATHMGGQTETHSTLSFSRSPSVQRGAALIGMFSIPAEVQTLEWQRSHTPAEALAQLQQANPEADQADLMDVVVYLWVQEGIPEETIILYNKNCATCHGLEGRSEGIAAEVTTERPVAFANLSHIFTRRGDVLYAKIRRGGMGTDMPNFGTVFTPEETWALVDYIWVLAFAE